VEPNQNFGPYVKKTDIRIAKIFRVKDRRFTAGLDILNLFNTAGVLVVNTTVGPSWQNPQQVLGGRLFRLSTRVDF
jgi:hypothetical protein